MISHIMLADGIVDKYDVLTIGRFDNTVAKTVWPDVEAMSNIIGIALNPGGDGAEINVCLCGVVVDPAFDWEAKKPLYVSSSGRLTQMIPSQSIFKIGKALSKDVAFINPSELFLLFKP